MDFIHKGKEVWVGKVIEYGSLVRDIVVDPIENGSEELIIVTAGTRLEIGGMVPGVRWTCRSFSATTIGHVSCPYSQGCSDTIC